MNNNDIKNLAILTGSAVLISLPAIGAATTIKVLENKFGPKPAALATLSGMALLYAANKIADKRFREDIAKLDLAKYMNK